MSDVGTIEDKYRALAGRLDEAMLRLWAAVEARTLGRGGVSTVAKATGLSRGEGHRLVANDDLFRFERPGIAAAFIGPASGCRCRQCASHPRRRPRRQELPASPRRDRHLRQVWPLRHQPADEFPRPLLRIV